MEGSTRLRAEGVFQTKVAVVGEAGDVRDVFWCHVYRHVFQDSTAAKTALRVLERGTEGGWPVELAGATIIHCDGFRPPPRPDIGANRAPAAAKWLDEQSGQVQKAGLLKEPHMWMVRQRSRTRSAMRSRAAA